MKNFICILSLMTCFASLQAAAYVSNPMVESGGNGSKDSPWPSLEKCISSGKLSKLKPGDTLYLLKGHHGAASITGVNPDFINISAAPGHEVTLSKLSMNSVAKWHIKGLRISPTFATSPYKGTIVSFGDRSTSSGQCIIEDCEIFGVDDHSTLDFKGWMGLNSGVLMGRHAKGSIVKNCYIRNTRFALSMSPYDGVAEGNIIENFSADGIRMTRDGQTAHYNVIKGAFATDAQGDKNHDDAIQCFLHNKGTGQMNNLTINHNIIMGHEPGVEPFSANNQGIGLFDGPLVNFHIEGNVVMVSHWHGVSVYDGQGCTITKNITWTKFTGKLKPWVMLGTKLKKAKDNTVTDNYAMSFNLKQPGTIESNNQSATKDIYEQGLKELAAKHFERFGGQYHRTAKRHRITGDKVDELPELASSEKVDGKNTAKKKSRVSGKIAKTSPKLVLIPGAEQQFNEELQGRLDSYLDSKRIRPRFTYSVFKQEVSIESKTGSSYKVKVPKLGSDMTLNLFKKLKFKDALAISKAIAEKEHELDNALLAFYMMASGNAIDASYHLRKAGPYKDQVQAAFKASE